MTGNTYSGGTTLVGGILQIGADTTVGGGVVTSGPLGTGTLTLSGGTLQNDSGASRTLANAISILGNVTLGSAGANGLNLSGPNTVTITGAPVITVAAPTTIGDQITGDTLVVAGPSTLTVTSAANNYTRHRGPGRRLAAGQRGQHSHGGHLEAMPP